MVLNRLIRFGGVARAADARLSTTPPTPLPSWSKPTVGLGGGNDTNFNATNAAIAAVDVGGGVLAGPVTARRTYTQTATIPATFAVSPAGGDVAANRESWWSWKPNVITFPTDVARQSDLTNMLLTVPAGHKLKVMVLHEPEDNIVAGDFTLAQWSALQAKVGEIVQSIGNPNIEFWVCLMGPWTFNVSSAYDTWDWDGAIPWDVVDGVAIDPYRTSADSTASLETILTVRNSGSGGAAAPSMMEKIVQWGKPTALAEWGAYNSTEASVATFITEAWTWLKAWNAANPTTPFASALWFDYTLIGSDNPLTGVEINAYAAIVADSKILV